jgi:PAS domain-containing protein
MADDTSAQAPARGWRLIVRWTCQFCVQRCGVPFHPAGPAMGVITSETAVSLFLSVVVATLTAALVASLLSRNLRLENRRMRGAINNMSQGLCMFDGNERLVVRNRRYMQMYNLFADIVTPGSTLHSLPGRQAHEERGLTTPKKEAAFAAYSCQCDALELKPWESPPCWADEDDRHPADRKPQALLKRMLANGISRFHPDPPAGVSGGSVHYGKLMAAVRLNARARNSI